MRNRYLDHSLSFCVGIPWIILTQPTQGTWWSSVFKNLMNKHQKSASNKQLYCGTFVNICSFLSPLCKILGAYRANGAISLNLNNVRRTMARNSSDFSYSYKDNFLSSTSINQISKEFFTAIMLSALHTTWANARKRYIKISIIMLRSHLVPERVESWLSERLQPCLCRPEY